MTIQEQIDDLTLRLNRGEYGYGHTASEAAATRQKIVMLQSALVSANATAIPRLQVPMVFASPAATGAPSMSYATAPVPWGWIIGIAFGLMVLPAILRR